jgi:hypothetical protein
MHRIHNCFICWFGGKFEGKLMSKLNNRNKGAMTYQNIWKPRKTELHYHEIQHYVGRDELDQFSQSGRRYYHTWSQSLVVLSSLAKKMCICEQVDRPDRFSTLHNKVGSNKSVLGPCIIIKLVHKIKLCFDMVLYALAFPSHVTIAAVLIIIMLVW